MQTVRTGPLIRPLAQLGLLAVLAATIGLGVVGWVVGAGSAAAVDVALSRGLARSDAGLGPADRVTFTRATLVGGVAALVATALSGTAHVTTLVTLAGVALVLDAVDGWVARRTGTVSMFGARFDMEVDAFLILVLSAYVARSTWWVLAIGLARYAFGAAAWLLPWLRRSMPSSRWRKGVAAVQGVVLVAATADVSPASVSEVALLVSLGLLVASFGSQSWWLWQRRREPAEPVPAPAWGRGREAVRVTLTLLAFGLVWFALVAPDDLVLLTPGSLLRIPVEGLVLVLLVLTLPVGARRPVAGAIGLALALLTLVKVLDMGFFAALDRPFNPVTDWGYLGPALGLLGDSVGRAGAVAVTVVASVLVLLLLVATTLSVIRLTGLVTRHRRTSLRAVAALGVAWVICAAAGVQAGAGVPVASAGATALALDQVREVRAGVVDRQAFSTASATDPFDDVPGRELLTGLRGKDVLVVFVESYGRVAVQGTAFSPQVDATLDAGTRRLRSAGFGSRSAFLTSPTFGGISWLAHSTLQSGLWIDNQGRYDHVLAGDRLTLSAAFQRAGWRTVSDVPSNRRDWPEGRSFYHYDAMYDARNVGYAGPQFSYAAMPDQYTLAAFRRLELARTHRPRVMAELDLVSSHTPWAPLPRLVPGDTLGDGSVYDGMPQQGDQPGDVWPDADRVRSAYAQSIRYSMESLVSFVATSHDKNLVLLVLGDHEPASIVSGRGASHDVPVSVIAHDPAVLDRISGWGWGAGLRPGPRAPVWRMDSFRDRFLTAYGPQPPIRQPTSTGPPRGP